MVLQHGYHSFQLRSLAGYFTEATRLFVLREATAEREPVLQNNQDNGWGRDSNMTTSNIRPTATTISQSTVAPSFRLLSVLNFPIRPRPTFVVTHVFQQGEKHSVVLSPLANYTDRAIAAGQRR
jgi:hypothetical protein